MGARASSSRLGADAEQSRQCAPNAWRAGKRDGAAGGGGRGRAALEELTRERVPLDWALTQVGLGGALERLGARESGTARLEEAVAAYRAALEELTREAAPHWHDFAEANLARCLARVQPGRGRVPR